MNPAHQRRVGMNIFSELSYERVLLLRENVNKLPRQNVNIKYSIIFLFFKYLTFSIDEFPRDKYSVLVRYDILFD
jgi:hypothetical protein